VNGDFNGGTYSDAATFQIGDATITNTVNVPNGWTASPGFHDVYDSTGPGFVVLGNNVEDPISAISQGFVDNPGTLYVTTFNLQGGGSGPNGYYFDVLLDGNIAFNFDPNGPFNSEFSFDFLGTGFDTLTFEGANNQLSYGLSDISVSPAPLPSTILLFIPGLGMLGFLSLRNKHNRQTARTACG
jgi:hypothetical protein